MRLAAVLLTGLVCLQSRAEVIPVRARTYSPPARASRPAIPIGKRVEIKAPLGLPPVPFPEDNPPTAETIRLGRKLFFDPLLSADGKISCSSCHNPKTAFTDPKVISLGIGDKVGTRNSMTLLNAAYHLTQFWDGRAQGLEDQASGPVLNHLEMDHSLVGVERRLTAHKEYPRMFEEAFGPGPITWEMVAKSLSSYERTLLSGNSPFDRYQYGGDKKAMPAAAIRGLALFMDNTLDGPNCISCHRIEENFATFTESRFHNTGVAWQPETKTYSDDGHFGVSKLPKDEGAFKVVTLRNVELTAPYMHNGSIKTLEESVDFYFKGGRPNPHLSGVVPHPGVPNIAKAEQAAARADIVEFLKALTGTLPDEPGVTR